MRLASLLYESRSGSTMLAGLLHRYSGINVIPENHLVSRVLLGWRAIPSQKVARDVIDAVCSELQFSELGISKQRLIDSVNALGDNLDRQSFLECCLKTILDELSMSPDRLTLVKCPCYECLEELTAMWPDTRFLHIVRDGRAVFSSLRKSRSLSRRGAMNANVVSAARSWKRKVVSTSTNQHCLTVRYEDLVSNESNVLKEILDFLNVTESGRTIDNSQPGFEQRIGTAQQHLHQRVGSGTDVSRSDAWQKELPRPLIAAYGMLAHRTLDRMGYATASEMSVWDQIRGGWLLLLHGIALPWRSLSVVVSSIRSSNDFRYKVARKLRRWKRSVGNERLVAPGSK